MPTKLNARCLRRNGFIRLEKLGSRHVASGKTSMNRTLAFASQTGGISLAGRWLVAFLMVSMLGCSQQPSEQTSATEGRYPGYTDIGDLTANANDGGLFAAMSSHGEEGTSQASPSQQPLLPRQVVQVSPAKARTTLNQNSSNPPLLDVGIVVFQPLASNMQRSQSPLVRKAEARYLPYVLKQTLEQSSRWGVVRVMPDRHGSAELAIEAILLASDGEVMALRLVAQDSAGRLWLDREYRMRANDRAYEHIGQEPFQALFDRIESDLYLARLQLTTQQSKQLQPLAVLRYGERMVPDGFASYYQESDDGSYKLMGLPAASDPMYRRIQQLRRYEYFFIDTADEQYLSLFNNMQRTYHHWRQYSRELVVYMRDYQQRQAGQASGFRRGSLASMNEVYSDYEWFRMQERYLKELSSGFNNQVLPTVLNLDDQVVHLEGGYEQQYQQWQAILAEIFQLERGTSHNSN
tara:strand:+ start:6668 stop:8059 length:1392 start_codon:yes stop_codon:yes gene_type:complete